MINFSNRKANIRNTQSHNVNQYTNCRRWVMVHLLLRLRLNIESQSLNLSKLSSHHVITEHMIVMSCLGMFAQNTLGDAHWLTEHKDSKRTNKQAKEIRQTQVQQSADASSLITHYFKFKYILFTVFFVIHY